MPAALVWVSVTPLLTCGLLQRYAYTTCGLLQCGLVQKRTHSLPVVFLPACFCKLAGLCFFGAASEGFGCYFAVIEMVLVGADDLIGFVAFAGDDDDVVCYC